MLSAPVNDFYNIHTIFGKAFFNLHNHQGLTCEQQIKVKKVTQTKCISACSYKGRDGWTQPQRPQENFEADVGRMLWHNFSKPRL